jgi:hypothetical protein
VNGLKTSNGAILVALITLLWALLPMSSCGSEEPPPAPRQAPASGALQLITPAESGLADYRVRGSAQIQSGPRIELVSPAHHSKFSGGFPIEVLFRSGKRGHPVDMKSLRVVYLRAWGIDTTARLIEYLTPSGIKVPLAELPTGTHEIEIYIEDTEHNASRATFAVTIVE